MERLEAAELKDLLDRFYEIERYIEIMKQSREEVLNKLRKSHKVSKRWHFEVRAEKLE